MDSITLHRLQVVGPSLWKRCILCRHEYCLEKWELSSLFDGYVNARTTLQGFAEQYVNVLDDLYKKEAKAEFETFYTKPILKTPLPMEKLQDIPVCRDPMQTCDCIIQSYKCLHSSAKLYFTAIDQNCQGWCHLGCIVLSWCASNSHRGENLQYVLYQEAIKCVEEGLATDHSFKVALNTLREARIKISGSKKNAISAQKLETVASNSFRDKNMVTSHRDSHSLQTSHAGQKKANTAESCMYNSTFDFVWSNRSSEIEGKCGLWLNWMVKGSTLLTANS